MNLKVVGTGSKGNCYLLKASTGEVLMIECGVGIKDIKQALDFNYKKVVGCIVTHSHNDHNKSIKDVLGLGIKVFASKHTHEAKLTKIHHRANIFEPMDEIVLGGFSVKAFDVKHDVPTMGFLINHKECGNVLFLTDTYYCEYTFPNLNNILIEANFSQKIIDMKSASNPEMNFLRNRILKSHLSLEYCKESLKANDLSNTNNIVLIHLSDSNSDARRFQKEVTELTGKNVRVAENGLELEFNVTPF